MNYTYRVVNEEWLYRGFFSVKRYSLHHELFEGGESALLMRECIMAQGGVVAALPYDPSLKEFIFIEQFRIGAMVAGANPWQYEIVAGFMDRPQETPEECMQRELQEEIGVQAQRLQPLFHYFGGAGSSAGHVRLYLAEIDASQTKDITGLAEEGENIKVHRVSYSLAFEQLHKGLINNATMLVALQAFLLRHGEGQDANHFLADES